MFSTMFAPMYDNGIVVDATVVAVIALLVDGIVGDMNWLFSRITHPVAILGRMISLLDRRLNREDRGEVTRLIRGLIVTVLIVAFAAAFGWLLSWLARTGPFVWVIEVGAVVILLAQRSLYDRVLAVARALTSGGLAQGREAVRHIVGRDPATLDRHGVARASVESLAENFADGVVAPLFLYLVLGLPGMFAYKAINTLDSMIGYRSPKYASFGLVAARLDDAVNWIPARLAAVLIAAAAVFAPTANPLRAARVMWRDAKRHPSVNAGWPEGAIAGALDLSLGGPRYYPGGVSEAVWIGGGNPRVTVEDIRRALLLFGIACLLNGLVVIGLMVLRLT
jgi:adenosylcobinamide-phosphate synthase